MELVNLSASAKAGNVRAHAGPGTCEHPALAPGAELAGEMPAVSFEDRQWLVQRDGRYLQVSELFYRVLEQCDGVRTPAEIARNLTQTTDWIVEEPILRQLIEKKLVPLGLVVGAGEGPATGGAPISSPRSPLSMAMRMKMLSPHLIHPLSAALQLLFAPVVLVLALIGIVAAHVWLYAVHGVSASLYNVLYTPGALLAVFGTIVVAGLFHELGHAAALRYGGGRVRGIGAGLYLVYPAFYTDVTDVYRLGRAARIRTDLGGIYFHLLFGMVLIGLGRVTGSDVLFVTAVLLNAEGLRQFIPFLRLDGYWLLADLTGVPDFFSQIGPFLRSVFRTEKLKGTRLPALRPAARAVFAVYTLVAVPALAYLFILMLVKLPAFLGTARDALVHQTHFLRFGESALTWALALTQMLFLVLPLLGTVLVLYSVGRIVSTISRGILPAPVLRFAAAVGLAAILAAAAFTWNGSEREMAASPRQQHQQISTAEAVLRKAADVLAATKGLTGDLEGAVGEDRFTGTLAMKRPNLVELKVSSNGGLGEFHVVANSSNVFVYFPAQNQFTKGTARVDGRNINGFVIDHVRHFFQPQSMADVGQGGHLEYAGTQSLNGLDVDVIDAVYKGRKPRAARYFISRADGLVHRIAWRTVGSTEADEETSWVELRNVKRDIAIDDQRFAWTPPTDATPLQMPDGVDLSGAAAAK